MNDLYEIPKMETVLYTSQDLIMTTSGDINTTDGTTSAPRWSNEVDFGDDE